MPALIATANTCIAALANLEEWGMDMSKVKVISVLGSKQGVERVARERPEVEVGQAL
jgi:uracil phosphoribosyltransferase